MLIAFVPSLLRLPSLAMFLLPLFLLPRLGALLLSSLLSICPTFSFPLLRGFLWVRWWLRMLLFNVIHVYLVLVVLACLFLFYGFGFNMESQGKLAFPLRAMLQSSVPLPQVVDLPRRPLQLWPLCPWWLHRFPLPYRLQFEPVVMVWSTHSHIGRCSCGDSWVHLLVCSLVLLGCRGVR